MQKTIRNYKKAAFNKHQEKSKDDSNKVFPLQNAGIVDCKECGNNII